MKIKTLSVLMTALSIGVSPVTHANGRPRQQGRIFVQVQQPDGATR
jgi:hypothetical protein